MRALVAHLYAAARRKVIPAPFIKGSGALLVGHLGRGKALRLRDPFVEIAGRVVATLTYTGALLAQHVGLAASFAYNAGLRLRSA